MDSLSVHAATGTGEKAILGSKVLLDKDRVGVIRFVGSVAGTKEIMYGIELLQAVGDNDGMRGGIRYFYAAPKRGIFVTRKEIRRIITHRKTKSSARIYDLVDPMIQIHNKSV